MGDFNVRIIQNFMTELKQQFNETVMLSYMKMVNQLLETELKLINNNQQHFLAYMRYRSPRTNHSYEPIPGNVSIVI